MVAKRLTQTVSEFAPKNTAEHFHRQEETGSRADPSSVIRRWSASWHNAVKVRM
jgi:hypothetical protein